MGSCDQVKERQGRLEAALGLFNQAVQLSQDNALVRYHRAKVLIAMKKYKVGDRVSSVLARRALIGRIYSSQRRISRR